MIDRTGHMHLHVPGPLRSGVHRPSTPSVLKKYVNLVLRGVNRILSLTKFLEDIIYIYIFN
jgi:hypothetical protein